MRRLATIAFALLLALLCAVGLPILAGVAAVWWLFDWLVRGKGENDHDRI